MDDSSCCCRWLLLLWILLVDGCGCLLFLLLQSQGIFFISLWFLFWCFVLVPDRDFFPNIYCDISSYFCLFVLTGSRGSPYFATSPVVLIPWLHEWTLSPAYAFKECRTCRIQSLALSLAFLQSATFQTSQECHYMSLSKARLIVSSVLQICSVMRL